MTKKCILIFFIILFIFNCQKIQTTNADFEVTQENEDLTPDIQPPVDTDDGNQDGGDSGDGSEEGGDEGQQPQPEPLKELTEQELSIIDTESFTMTLYNPFVLVSRLIEFNVSGDKINNTVLHNTSETEVVIKVKLIERAGGDLESMKKGITIQNNGNNNYQVVYNEHLKTALPQLGTYAKYQIDVYIKDLRDNGQKKYLVTHRQFDFKVYGR